MFTIIFGLYQEILLRNRYTVNMLSSLHPTSPLTNISGGIGLVSLWFQELLSEVALISSLTIYVFLLVVCSGDRTDSGRVLSDCFTLAQKPISERSLITFVSINPTEGTMLQNTTAAYALTPSSIPISFVLLLTFTVIYVPYSPSSFVHSRCVTLVYKLSM